MKIIIVCLMVMLPCSCRPDIDNSRSGDPNEMRKRRDEIKKIMKDNYRDFDCEFEIRGPLTVAQFEEELIELHEESSETRVKIYGPTERFADSETGRDCARIMGEYRGGDELYFFTSDMDSWINRRGGEGYVLIRKNKIVDGLVTRVN